MRVIRRGLRYTLRGISDFGGDMAAGGESGLPLAGLLARYQTVPLSSGVLQALVPSGGSRRSSIGPSQQPGRCGDFDGLNDYIATNVNPYSLFPNGGTIEFWFNADTIAAGTNRIFTIGTSGGGTRIAAALVGDQVQMLGSGGALLHTTTALTGVWYHVAIATNFNNSHHFYVNGVLIGTATTAWSFADADTFRIAADTQVVVGRHYDGKLSHFRVWGGQLTDEQVRDLYLNGPANSLSRDSLELEYLLENQHSNFVFDSSGAERHGSKIGVDASVGQFHHEGSSVPFSDENERGYTQLAWFDGVDDRIVISNNAVTDGFFPMEDYTLEIEAVRDNFNFQPFFHLSDPDNLNKYIQFKFPNQLMVTFSAGMAEHTATTLIAPYSTAGVGFGQLFTVKAVIRQGFQGLYINDVLMASKDLVGTFVFNDSMLTLGFGQTTGASTAYARSLVKSVKLTDNLTGEVKLHLDFSTLKDGKSIVDSSTGKVYAIEGADSRFMQRIPAATATTDASGGTLTYTGKSPIDAKFKQSWCGNFDGTDDYIQFNNFVDASLLEQGRATVRINADGGYTTIFGFGNTDDSIVVGLDNGMVWLLALQNQYNDFIYKETPAIISNGVEYLIEVSWGNGNYSIKVDGVLQPLVDWSSETISGDSVVLANNTPLVIGADTFGAGSLLFAGHIFDLQIYDKNGDLFSHVPICEGEGSPVAFDVVSGEAGTITAADTTVGGTFWGKQDSYHYNATEGYDSIALFNGTSSQLATDYAPGELESFGFWFFTPTAIDKTSAMQGPMAWGNTGFNNTMAFGAATSVIFDEAITLVTNISARLCVQNITINPGWHHIAFVWNDAVGVGPGTYEIWLDGVKQTIIERGTFAASKLNPSRLKFGTYENDALFYNGALRDYYDYTGQWTEADIASLAAGGAPANYTTHVPLALHPGDTTSHQSGNLRFVNTDVARGTWPQVRPTLSNPPALHNGAESQIDWTGGVAFPQSSLPVNILSDNFAAESFVGFWNKTGMAATSGDAQITEPPLSGLSNPYGIFREDSSTSEHYTRSPVFSAGANSYWTAMAIVKYAGRRYYQLSFSNNFGAGNYAVFDLLSGSVVGETNGVQAYQNMVQVDTGTYLLIYGAFTAAGGASYVYHRLSDSNVVGPVSYTGDGSSGAIIYGYGLYKGVVPDAYIPLGFTNSINQSWYLGDPFFNPQFGKHVSDGQNLKSLSSLLSYRYPLIGSSYRSAMNATKDPYGLIYENFNAANRSRLGSRFATNTPSNTFSISSNKASAAQFFPTMGYLPALSTANHEFEVDITIPSTWQVVLLVRSDMYTRDGYAFHFKNQATDTYKLGSWAAGILTPYAVVNATPPSVPAKMKVRIDGNTLTGFMNGTQVIQADTSAWVDYSANRRVGVTALFVGSNITLDNFKARDI